MLQAMHCGWPSGPLRQHVLAAVARRVVGARFLGIVGRERAFAQRHPAPHVLHENAAGDGKAAHDLEQVGALPPRHRRLRSSTACARRASLAMRGSAIRAAQRPDGDRGHREVGERQREHELPREARAAGRSESAAATSARGSGSCTSGTPWPGTRRPGSARTTPWLIGDHATRRERRSRRRS